MNETNPTTHLPTPTRRAGGQIAAAEPLPCPARWQPTEEPRQGLVISWTLAIVVHVALLFTSFSIPATEATPPEEPRPVTVLSNIKFEPPKPPPVTPTPPQPRQRATITVPSFEEVTILEPPQELPPPDLELPRVDEPVVIPAGPPEPEESAEPMRLRAGVLPPEPLSRVEPRYTETARRLRIQGMVILEAIIDAEGQVTDVKVLRGLPAGLDRQAVEAVQQWRYKPAVFRDRPVPVIMTVTVQFETH
ncbi:MAG: TonB family protein [Acidobacteriota bacterium]|nr:TonB family protein [Acidobacteriota bacterium]